ncbi:MAG: NUDIX hydrolase [Prevotella sp.]|jgi:8-oxo-dGTP diphosphatase|uniref:NUDIX hydrolase n=1 Tax=Segatella cerevisiae TaxID=2053716 RepID=A0ABT1BUT2_9BACT|nr:NUDIX hydrolase [Segatella cerevisiae]MCH3994452.1 NUDIX hydrolase [Prevotella sp.]MCI1246902.1 NUDIX hydrolase [Prevotella sp.]MCO6024849.1 NUDIX hydrolase [Segatella cerevisiae]
MYTYRYPHPSVTADCLIFAEDGGDEKILLVERKNPPYKGCWAFPGGFMEINETAETAASRELQEETGLQIRESDLHQVGAFSQVDRDPRERVITIAYYTVLNVSGKVRGGDDAGKAAWFSLKKLPDLAFDHAAILKVALQRRKEDHSGI